MASTTSTTSSGSRRPSDVGLLELAIRTDYIDGVRGILDSSPHPTSQIHHVAARVFNDACARGNEDIIRVLLEHGALLDRGDENGDKPIHCAARDGHIAVVTALLEYGASPNCVGQEGNTPLHYAASIGSIDIVTALLEHGASANCVDQEGITPLHWAANNGSIAVVTALLEHGASPECVNQRGKTPLHCAARSGIMAVVTALLDQGASPKCLNRKGESPLHVAARKGTLAVVKHLVETFPENDRAAYINLSAKLSVSAGMTALHAACYPTAPDGCVEFLLASGANRDAVWDRGPGYGTAENRWTPAHCACFHLRLDAMKLLLEPNSDVFGSLLSADEIETPRTCLQRACESDNHECVEWLLDVMKIEDIHKLDGMGDSAWDIALTRFDYAKYKVAVSFAAKEKREEDFHEDCKWRHAFHGGFSEWTCRLSNIPGLVALLGDLLKSETISESDFSRLFQGFSSWFSEAPCGLQFRDPEDMVFKSQAPAMKDCHTIKTSEPEDDGNEPQVHEKKGTDIDRSDVQIQAITEEGLESFISIVFPYLDLGKVNTINSWRHPKRTALMDTESRLRYCRSPNRRKPMQYYPSPTLDEFCCQALSKEALTRRNCDQVILSLQPVQDDKTMDSLCESNQLIVVQQAWLWKVHQTLIVSGAETLSLFLPGGEKNMLKYIGLQFAFWVGYTSHPHHIRLKDSMSGLSLSIFKMFEQAIAAVSEKVDTYLRDITIEGIDLETEKDCLHRIIDIQDELSMIKRVILQQEVVWRSFSIKAWPEYWPNGSDGNMQIPREQWKSWDDRESDVWEMIIYPQLLFKEYYKRIAQLDEDAQRVERSVTLMLDLKSKHATIRESHASAIMSAAVVGFTIVTIIFAPMSYMASLFALPINTFQNHQDPSRFSSDSGAYRSSYFAKWTVTATFATVIFTALCMWLAIKSLKVSVIRPALQELWNLFKKFAKDSMQSGTKQDEAGQREKASKPEKTAEAHQPKADNMGGSKEKDNQTSEATKPSRPLARLFHRKKATSTDEEKAH